MNGIMKTSSKLKVRVRCAKRVSGEVWLLIVNGKVMRESSGLLAREKTHAMAKAFREHAARN